MNNLRLYLSILWLSVTYPKVIPCNSLTCSLYMSRQVCKLVVESPAMNIESKQVFFWELGCSRLHSWRFILKLPCPLSPPSFSQISCSGITECHVSHAGVLMGTAT